MTPTEVKQLLLNAGCPAASVMNALGQAVFECGSINFDSAVALADKNLTGIIYLNAHFQHNATQGTLMPARDGVGHYAHFATPQDWANDFCRILRLNMHGEGRPIDAVTPEDYVHRLKVNGYFGGKEEDYLRGLKSDIKKLEDWFASHAT